MFDLPAPSQGPCTSSATLLGYQGLSPRSATVLCGPGRQDCRAQSCTTLDPTRGSAGSGRVGSENLQERAGWVQFG